MSELQNNIKLALGILPPFSKRREGGVSVHESTLVRETMNRFGEDDCVPEKRGRYSLTEKNEYSPSGFNSTIVLTHEKAANIFVIRGVEIRNKKITKLVGFCEGLTDEEKEEKAAELFMGFATCTRSFKVGRKAEI